MSGIYGIINLKNTPVDPSQMNKMEELLIHRGVDGKAQWIEGHVGLGHLKLEITPESEYEKLPLEYKQWVITADARIDNRHELDEPLSISEEEQAFIPDTTYIVKAYEKWGKDCVKHLIGDFAFAIWDTVEKTLFCARDHIGIKPFFYLKTEDKFIFASELKTIVELREIPVELNESKLGDWMYRIQDLNNPTDTLFMNVKRLMPAHFGIVQSNNFVIEQYWKLVRTKVIKLPNDEAYAEKLRDLMIQAVECRMRTKYEIGVTLSGGLDSSSVACIAARKLAKEGKNLYTASSVLPNNWEGIEEDEREYIDAVIEQEKNIKNISVTVFPNDFFNDLDTNIGRTYSPVNPFYNMDNALALSISEQDSVRLILSGYAGDMAVSQKANTLLAFLISRRKWYLAVNLIKKRTKIGDKYLPILKEGFMPLIPSFFKKIYGLIKKFSKTDSFESIFNEEFLKKHDLNSDKRDFFLNKTNLPILENIKFAFATSVSDFEEINIQRTPYQIEEWIPFADIRLLEFLANIPIQHFQMGGWKRGLIRFAMQDILSSKIQFRHDKLGYMPNFNRNILTNKNNLYSILFKNLDNQILLNPQFVKKLLDRGYIFKKWSSKDFSVEMVLISIQLINVSFFNYFKTINNDAKCDFKRN